MIQLSLCVKRCDLGSCPAGNHTPCHYLKLKPLSTVPAISEKTCLQSTNLCALGMGLRFVWNENVYKSLVDVLVTLPVRFV